ncbi:hypothetical protein LWI29_034708 [Acer saccharum]|uniref:Uncharacterized protein n=1 Tax=Acer saccharum TaxID=4024 RepID=A0AA39REZ7_ACESA|nr:hypothetical protein LWI29_034708 [Acer saccharum]
MTSPNTGRKGPQPNAGTSTRSRRKNEGKDLMQQIRVTHTISGGPTLAEVSKNSRKNHARKDPKLISGQDVFRVSRGSREYPRSAKIIFTEDDAYNIVQPHDNPMVITFQIANCWVHRILIDTGSSVDILFKGALEKFNLKNPYYNSCTTPLFGFTGDSVMPVGTHNLPVIIGEAPLQQNIMTEFIVFPVGTKVGEVRGDQQTARTCHTVSADPTTLTKQHTQVTYELGHRISEPDPSIIEESEMPDLVIEGTKEEESGWTGGHPTERLVEIQIRKDDPAKVVKIEGALDSGIRRSLVELLEEYNNIFAWNHDEMPGIPLNLVVHRLAVDATVKPVKQKRRHFNSERNITV